MTSSDYLRRPIRALSHALLERLAGEQCGVEDLAAILDSLDVAILITDDDFEGGPHILYANRAFSAMCGYTMTALYGRTPEMLQGPQTDRRKARAFRRRLQNRGRASTILTNYAKDGRAYRCLIVASRIVLSQGRVRAFIAFETEIDGNP